LSLGPKCKSEGGEKKQLATGGGFSSIGQIKLTSNQYGKNILKCYQKGQHKQDLGWLEKKREGQKGYLCPDNTLGERLGGEGF